VINSCLRKGNRAGLGLWVDGGWVLSEATSEMSPLPRFWSLGVVRAGGGGGRNFGLAEVLEDGGGNWSGEKEGDPI